MAVKTGFQYTKSKMKKQALAYGFSEPEADFVGSGSNVPFSRFLFENFFSSVYKGFRWGVKKKSEKVGNVFDLKFTKQYKRTEKMYWPDRKKGNTIMMIEATFDIRIRAQKKSADRLSTGNAFPLASGFESQLPGAAPREIGMNPGTVGMNPGMVGTNPGAVGTFPGVVGTNPGTVGTNPGTVGTFPAEVGAYPKLAGLVFRFGYTLMQERVSALHLKGAVLQLEGTVLHLGGTVLQLEGANLQPEGTVPHLGGMVLQLGGANLQPEGTVPHLGGMVLQLGGVHLQLEGTVLQLGGIVLQLEGVHLQLEGTVLQLEGVDLQFGAKSAEPYNEILMSSRKPDQGILPPAFSGMTNNNRAIRVAFPGKYYKRIELEFYFGRMIIQIQFFNSYLFI